MNKLVMLLLFPVLAFAQTGILKGVVTFDKNVKGQANIYVSDLKLGTLSTKEGSFEIKNVPVGKHLVFATYVGFKNQKREIEIKEGEVTEVNFELMEDIFGIDEIVVSATRSKLSRSQAPVIVTVTDKHNLEAVQALTLSEGLSFQPGLRVETNCQNCGYSQVRINGLEGAYSQILVNSRPVFSALSGIYGLDQIPANTIDRIEVVRGGGSALFGANAIAGTINIITKDPYDNSFQVGTNMASINGKVADYTTSTSGTIVTEDLDAGVSFFGLYKRRKPYDHNGDTFTEITSLNNKAFGSRIFYKPNDRSRIGGELTVLKEFRRGGNKLDLLPTEADVTEQIDSDVLMSSLNYETVNKAKTNKYSLYVSGSISDNKNFYGGKGDNAFGECSDKIFVSGGQFSHNFKKDVLTTGVEYKYNKTNDIKRSINVDINQKMKIFGFYSQYEWNPLDKLRVLGGLRLDKHNLLKDSKGVVVNPRLNVLYKAGANGRFRTSYAKGFRAPQFFTDDLHVQIAAGELQRVILASDLVSETSHSFTASYDWSKNYENNKQLQFTLEPFCTVLKNPFILEATSDDTIQEKRNGDSANVYGVNLEFKFAPNREFRFESGLTVQEGKFENTVDLGVDAKGESIMSDKFLRSPNVYGNFIFTYAPNVNVQHNLSSVYTGSMHVNHTLGEREYNGKKIEEAHDLVKTNNFFELNWKSFYNFELDNHKHLKFQINTGIQNILNSYQSDFDKGADRDAAYVYGPSRPRTFFIGVKFGNSL